MLDGVVTSGTGEAPSGASYLSPPMDADEFQSLYINVLNVTHDEIWRNIERAILSGLPVLPIRDKPNGLSAVVVGGGPSLACEEMPGSWIEVRGRQNGGAVVYALNGAGKFLVDRGVVPDALVILDARPDNAFFIEGIPTTTKLYLASQCHPVVFDVAKDHDVMVWHPGYGHDLGRKLEELERRPCTLIGGGNSVGPAALALTVALGHRRIACYGLDSSYEMDATGNPVRGHAYPQPLNDGERTQAIRVNGRRFILAPWMARQVTEFRSAAQAFANDMGCEITVHGDGALPEAMKAEFGVVEAV